MSTPNTSQEPDIAIDSQALIIRPVPSAPESIDSVTNSQPLTVRPAESAPRTLDVTVQHPHANTGFRQTEAAILLGRNEPTPTITTERQGVTRVCEILGETIESMDRLADEIKNVRLKLEGLAAYLKDTSASRSTAGPNLRAAPRQRSQARPL